MNKILVIGSDERLREFSALSLNGAEFTLVDQMELDTNHFRNQLEEEESAFLDMEGNGDESFEQKYDLDQFIAVFDLSLDENHENLMFYSDYPELIVVGCAVKQSLVSMAYSMALEPGFKLYGINSIPTFLSRPVWEISSWEEQNKAALESLLDALGKEYEWVEDRIGMVIPRILFMIINEACFVLGEGTADIHAIDQAMKLGTNYPYGPFEWADLIGLEHIYEVLRVLSEDSGDSRYKMAPKLKEYFLKEKTFHEKVLSN